MTPEQAEEQVRKDASDRMQHNTTSDLSARLMCRVGFRELTLLLAHYDGLKRAHAASLAPAVPEGWETGWLIERYSSRSQSLKAQWLKAELFGWDEEKAAWTTDASEALRLSRKVDAEALIAELGWTEARATEHQWIDARPLPTEEESEG